MNLISYSLFGTRFLIQALQRGNEARRHLSLMQLRFHVSDDVPLDFRNRLIEQDHQVVVCGQNVDRSGIFWRYWPLGDPDVSSTFVCDVDKRIDGRLMACIGAWQYSDRNFVVPTISGNGNWSQEHQVKSGKHPDELFRADAGFFGVRNVSFPDIKERIAEWCDRRQAVDRWDDNRFVTEELIPGVEDEEQILRFVPPSEGTRVENCPPCKEATTQDADRFGRLLSMYRARLCASASECGKPCKQWVKALGVNMNVCMYDANPISLDEAWIDRSQHCRRGAW